MQQFYMQDIKFIKRGSLTALTKVPSSRLTPSLNAR
jgi:hypothetical protein